MLTVCAAGWVWGWMVAASGAGAAAYATTRADTIGDYARSTGQAAVSTFESAKKYNAEHNITGKASECASAAANKAVKVNKQYQITEKIGSAISLGTSKVRVCCGCGILPSCRLWSCGAVQTASRPGGATWSCVWTACGAALDGVVWSEGGVLWVGTTQR